MAARDRRWASHSDRYLLPSPWRWLALGAGISSIIGSILPLMKAAPNKQQGVKQEWQTVLMQLDLLGEELAQLENEQQQKQQQISRAHQALTPFLVICRWKTGSRIYSLMMKMLLAIKPTRSSASKPIKNGKLSRKNWPL